MDKNFFFASQELVRLASSMLGGELSYFEGARSIVQLRPFFVAIGSRDSDFDAFSLIDSEADHLPHVDQRKFLSHEALARLEPEFSKTEKWADTFARSACANIIARFQV